jgi:hypothetical protein
VQVTDMPEERSNRVNVLLDDEHAAKLHEAALYEAPFEYVASVVRPMRDASRLRGVPWWHHKRPAPDMRAAVWSRGRFLATSNVAKHRLWVWLEPQTIAGHACTVVARDDDYTFGVLQSRTRELWSRATGTQLREAESGTRYTPRTCFETFPFPDPTPEQRERVREAAHRLVELRDGWLNPPGLDPADLARCTLTNLYNARPTWLANAHADLDAAVLAAYGWPNDLPDAAILECLLAMNLDLASREGNPGVKRMAFRAALRSMPAGGADEDFEVERDVPRPSEFA